MMLRRHIHHQVDVLFILCLLNLSHLIGVNELLLILLGKQINPFYLLQLGFIKKARSMFLCLCLVFLLLLSVLGLDNVYYLCGDVGLFLVP